jgi:hypothetical protein
MGTLYRNPQRITTLRKYIEEIALDNYEAGRAEYERLVPSGDPPYLDFLVKKVTYDSMDWTREIMSNENIGLQLNMRWSVRDITGCGLKLFTSDRPILMTNGLLGDNAHLVMPISPHKAFIACNTKKTEEYLFALSSMHFAKNSNRNVLRFAQKYAWNSDDQLLNRANEYLGIDAAEGEAFFLAAPNRALQQVRSNHDLPPQL